MFQFPAQMMRVFKDEQMQAAFERDGFVIVDFYTKAEVAELEQLYYDLHPVEEKGFYPSTFSKDKKYRQTADEEVRRVGSRWMNENLQDFKTMCGSFIVKYPGPDSTMCVHQDMTLVDETKFTGINIWCPLIDLSDENGVIQVLKGSHRIIPTYRGATVPCLYGSMKDEDIVPYLAPVYLKAGQAVIFDQSIIHYSAANLSDKIRITTNIYFTHKDADFRIAYYNKDAHGDKVELFKEDDSFMTDFEQFGDNIFDKPKIGKSIGLFDYNFPKLDAVWLANLYPEKAKELKAKQEALTTVFDPQPEQKSEKKSFLKRLFETIAN
ncbi:MAG: phytanoyl-CoA dioxygenase family protein [Chitinophagales bacterium]|jgi:ectoine hydroxylase-related dioxygenase (phytanoyl-CoA dioxygenase family)|nr:phytanoyl-CoA dioxygenase family protein [Chitinophagales bacterium]